MLFIFLSLKCDFFETFTGLMGIYKFNVISKTVRPQVHQIHPKKKNTEERCQTKSGLLPVGVQGSGFRVWGLGCRV
jgi:hypothetical protein